MTNHNDIRISELRLAEVNETSWLLANSMCTNPNHMAIFKSTELPARLKQQRMFEMVLRSQYNKTFIAKIDGQIAGTMSYTSCQHCQMSPFDILKLTPRLIRMFGSHLIPVLRWRMNWSRHDYKKEHVHFGPLAVDIYYQGQGIGKALLSRFCEYLDTTSQTAYLETDKAENVSLYEKFGFNVLQTDRIFGVTNWFMLRKQH